MATDTRGPDSNMALTNPPDVSATSDDVLRFLEPHVSAAWDYYSPRDG